MVVGGFVAVYLAFFNNDSPPPLTLSSTGTTIAGAPTDPKRRRTRRRATAAQRLLRRLLREPCPASNLSGTWTAAESSIAGYRVREARAAPTKSDAVGRTQDVNGSVTIEGSGDVFTATAADLTVDVTTLVSDSDRRDRQITHSGLETTPTRPRRSS